MPRERKPGRAFPHGLLAHPNDEAPRGTLETGDGLKVSARDLGCGGGPVGQPQDPYALPPLGPDQVEAGAKVGVPPPGFTAIARTIWKYVMEPPYLRDATNVTLEVPRAARVAHVGSQHDYVVVWFELDPRRRTERRRFLVLGTGRPIPEDADHVGTVQIGAFVWHVFEASL